ncbi:MAG: penicillin-binding transpeptidase domain-containing protein, partial [Clostridiaceae bacterium]|nr:penicillin-binding transpeptidase domain-containing protein [Clostridiaceae bacterium]
KSHAWFVGFAPAENPKIAIAVLIENGGGGGSAAAPIASKVLKKALSVIK